jgi:hypothetical protein
MENNRNVSVSVGTDNVEISSQKNKDTERIFFSIINTSTGGQVISISFTDEAGAGQGIALSPGGSHSESKDAGFRPTQARICGIASAAGGSLSFSERIVVGGQ